MFGRIILSSASFCSSKFAIFLSLITNYIFHNEYLKLTLFSTIVYILHFITHSLICVLKYLLFITHVKALKTSRPETICGTPHVTKGPLVSSQTRHLLGMTRGAGMAQTEH